MMLKTDIFYNVISLRYGFIFHDLWFVFRCNTDLGENDLEVEVIRGLQYNLPDSKYACTHQIYISPNC